MPVRGGVELFVLGGTRDDTADRGITPGSWSDGSSSTDVERLETGAADP